MITLLTHDLSLFTLVQRALVHIARERKDRPLSLVMGETYAEVHKVLDLSRLLIIDCVLLQTSCATALLGELEAHCAPELPWALVLPAHTMPATLAPLLVRAGRREIVTVVGREHAGDAEAWVPHIRQALVQRVVERATVQFREVVAGAPESGLFTELFRVTPRVQTVAELPQVLGQQYRGWSSSTRTLSRRLQDLQAPAPSTLLGLFRLAHYRHLHEEPFTQETIARALSYPNAAALRRSFNERAGLRLADVRPLSTDTVTRWCAQEIYHTPPDKPLPERVARLCLTN